MGECLHLLIIIFRSLIINMNQSSDTRLDATRMLDGTKVILKKVSRDSSDAQFGRLLSSPPYSSNPRNRCVPVYAVLDITDDEGPSIMAIPDSLDTCFKVDFDTVGEVVEFVRQMLDVSGKF